MFLVYKVEGQPDQRWHFLPGRMDSFEMIGIEKQTGYTYGEFKQKLIMEDTLARKALLWTMLRRDHGAISFKDLRFFDDELQLLRDKDELAEEIAGLEEPDDDSAFTDLERRAGLAQLRRLLSTAPDAPGKAPASTPADLPMSAPVDVSMPQAVPAL